MIYNVYCNSLKGHFINTHLAIPNIGIMYTGSLTLFADTKVCVISMIFLISLKGTRATPYSPGPKLLNCNE